MSTLTFAPAEVIADPNVGVNPYVEPFTALIEARKTNGKAALTAIIAAPHDSPTYRTETRKMQEAMRELGRSAVIKWEQVKKGSEVGTKVTVWDRDRITRTVATPAK